MDDKFKWAVTQNLAYRISSELIDFSKLEEDRNNLQILITGKLGLASEEMFTTVSANCKFYVDFNWPEKSPNVWCFEPWLKRGKPEWHTDANGELCWDQKLHWKNDIQAAVQEGTIGNAAEFGKTWIIRSVRNLLNRHLLAHRDGAMGWQRNWDFWAHHEAGEKEYLNTVSSRTR
jgi:hypothetical protein